MKKSVKGLIAVCLLAAVAFGGYQFCDFTDPTVEGKSPVAEYGTSLSISDVADVRDNRAGVTSVFQRADNGDISDDGQYITFPEPGEYSVVISAADAKGNCVESECPVTVVDTTAPVIRSIGNDLEIGYGETLAFVNTPDIKNTVAVDYEDISDVSLSVSSVQTAEGKPAEGCYTQDSEDSVTLLQLGDYILTVDVTDVFGNTSTAKTNVSVLDLTPPVISGLDRITISEYDALPGFLDAVTAADEIDGDLTQQLSIDAAAVQKGVPGTYKVQYVVSDLAGNTAEAERIVQIEDTTPPVLTVSKTSLSLTVGDAAPDYKSLVSAVDAADGDMAGKVTIDASGVDYSKAGTYEVKYSVSDASGNSASKTLKVTVNKKAVISSGSGGGGTVYITNTGEKYHASGCRYLAKSKISISKSDAKARGYTACSVCKPG